VPVLPEKKLTVTFTVEERPKQDGGDRLKVLTPAGALIGYTTVRNSSLRSLEDRVFFGEVMDALRHAKPEVISG